MSTQDDGKDAVIHLRLSTHKKELWVEAAGGRRKLSQWVRDRCDAGLSGADVPGLVALPSEGWREEGSTPSSQPSVPLSPVCGRSAFHKTQTGACPECGEMGAAPVRDLYVREFKPDPKPGGKK